MEVTMKEGAEHPTQIPIFFVSRKKGGGCVNFNVSSKDFQLKKKETESCTNYSRKKSAQTTCKLLGKKSYFLAVTSKLVLTTWAG